MKLWLNFFVFFNSTCKLNKFLFNKWSQYYKPKLQNKPTLCCYYENHRHVFHLSFHSSSFATLSLSGLRGGRSLTWLLMGVSFSFQNKETKWSVVPEHFSLIRHRWAAQTKRNAKITSREWTLPYRWMRLHVSVYGHFTMKPWNIGMMDCCLSRQEIHTEVKVTFRIKHWKNLSGFVLCEQQQMSAGRLVSLQRVNVLVSSQAPTEAGRLFRCDCCTSWSTLRAAWATLHCPSDTCPSCCRPCWTSSLIKVSSLKKSHIKIEVTRQLLLSRFLRWALKQSLLEEVE